MLRFSGKPHQHQLKNDATNTQGASTAALSGWAGIEDHLIKHDVGMIQDYADDIDTLLVFAGLFSAVLTAFVVETYSLLQPDSSDITNALLAYGFSSQIGQLSSPEEIKSTISSIVSSSQFDVSNSSRWINSLLFISLVLSLAAALFGILAKQWLREYLMWNSSLGAPRENVLVRQVRFEAWEAWNVAATISTIPALLELAMILFLVGIVVLMWTLDDIVAIAVTTAVTAFLGVVSIFTILPVFSNKCPYKSPTAWACVRLAGFLWPLRSSTATVSDQPSARSSWRQRDLDSCKIASSGGWWTGLDRIRSVVKLELAREKSHLDEKGGVIKDPWTIYVPDEETDALLTELSELVPLLQALSWVTLASQDPRVVRYVDECMETVHWNPDLSLKSHGSIDLVGVRAAANWFVLASLCSTLPSDTLKFQHLLSAPDSGDRFTSRVTQLRGQFGSALRHGTLTDGSPFVLTRAGEAGNERDSLIQWMHKRPILGHYICRILSQDVHLTVGRVLEFYKGISSEVLRNSRRAVDLFYTLGDIYTLSCSAPIMMDGSSHLLEALRDILCDQKIMDVLDAYCSGLTYAAFICAWKWFCVTSRSIISTDGILENYTLAVERKQDLKSFKARVDIEALILKYFDHNFQECSRDVLNMFIRTAVDWLWCIYIEGGVNSTPLESSNSSRILQRMIDAAESARSRNSRTFCLASSDDGSDEAWASALFHNKAWLMTYHPALFAKLLHALERSYCAHALVGDSAKIRVHLHSCLESMHLDRAGACQEDVAACSWRDHHRCTLGSRWADVGHRWIDVDCPKLPRPPLGVTISQNRRLRLRPLNQYNIVPEGWPIRNVPTLNDVSSEENFEIYGSTAENAHHGESTSPTPLRVSPLPLPDTSPDHSDMNLRRPQKTVTFASPFAASVSSTEFKFSEVVDTQDWVVI